MSVIMQLSKKVKRDFLLLACGSDAVSIWSWD